MRRATRAADVLTAESPESGEPWGGEQGSGVEGRPRVLIAHDFAETYGGAERILAAIAGIFPDAPVWAIAGRDEVAERMGVAGRFHTVLPENELLFRHYRMLAPAYPSIVRRHPLPEADVLLTSSYAFAHGFKTRNDAPQVCYCYSPLRFAWSMTREYAARLMPGRIPLQVFRLFAASMRRADRRAAASVDHYIAESRHIAEQIHAAYGRDSHVINPPVDCRLFRPTQSGHNGSFLFSGRLVEPYKRPGIVIEAFRSLPHKLVVAGDGPAYRDLKAKATPNVEFVGHLDDADLVPLMQCCAATIFPSVDDFGLTPVETMACGRPVIAFRGGGALETMIEGRTGEFFHEPTAKALFEVLERFDPDSYDPAAIRAHAESWDLRRFQEDIARVVLDAAPKTGRAAGDNRVVAMAPHL